ncbi:HYR-like domain-containing protein, partial [Bizionia saleffrena]
DTTAPTFTVPTEVTLECDQDITDLSVTGDVSDEADNCGNAVLKATYTDGNSTAGSCANASFFIRTWTLTDACGNTTTQEQTINIEDTMAPTFTVPTEVTLECDQDITDLTVTGDVSDEADNCGNAALEATYTDGASTAGSCANASSFIRTWTLTDACGNTTTQEQIINIEDTTAPTFTVPTEVTLECDQDITDLTVTGDVTDEADNCGNAALEATYTDSASTAGSCANASSFIRTWTLTDACGNTTTQEQIINIEDTTAPTFTVPAAVTLECDQDITDLTVTGDVTDEADNCGNAALEATYTDGASTAESCANESSFIRTWTLTDACGNTTTQEQTINIEDTTAPVIDTTAVENIAIQCGVTPDGTLEDWLSSNAGASATDNCSTVIWTNDYGQMSDVDCDNNAIIVTFTAADACGNSDFFTATYSIMDTVDPILSLPVDVTLECTDDTSTANTGVATATDDCATPTVSFTDVTTTGTCDSNYIITRTWTAIDACGNTTTQEQTINIEDT